VPLIVNEPCATYKTIIRKEKEKKKKNEKSWGKYLESGTRFIGEAHANVRINIGTPIRR
jgi:hypothetical protein